MASRDINAIGLRKRELVERSQAFRQDFDRQWQPVQVWVDKAELGFTLARQGRDLLVILTPILGALHPGKGSLLKATASLVSNWPALKNIWQGFRAMRRTAK
jgi:hypothetical protein